jgi:GNAT superfamily N-acetyltransferase
MERHDLSSFDSGVPLLDEWLKRRARANQASGATRTFVACEQEQVLAYYALAAGAVGVEQALGRFRRNMPDPIPVAILARLAVDRRVRRLGVGTDMFGNASLRVLEASEIIGIRGMLVHAISEEAQSFYLAMGFEPSPVRPMMLMLTLADIRAGRE